MTRIGLTFTKEVNGRRYMYGVYESPSTAYGLPIQRSLYVKYEGYLEGDIMARLPSGGAHAAHLYALMPFDPDRFEETILFPRKPS